ncbi:MAG TPA: bifunctional demethylmenaquinone methyltransferase/2-methoxy-6-polyprenyl-1,4-benzoquinol methylase UbiE [Dehalococcoidia bacterium]|nr:bifunctional demethylmenaquinone methyltransferase/2-methoxy-6-polyprenyl-1,4-benzoquinol methylase UbiE [Dehalococcoidia bacterium]
MEDKAAYVRNAFLAIADKYDLLNTLLSFNRDSYWRRFAASKAGVRGGERTLDVATGTGKLAVELAKEVGERGEVVGIDFCQRMLYKAKNKKINIELVLATLESLPFPDNTFDCATIGFALRNVTDIERTLQEMTRVIKRGGKVVCLEFAPPRRRLFQKIYRFYLFTILPFIGGLISRQREVYAYLPRSIVEFPRPEELKQTMEGVGLKEVQFYPLTWGIVSVHVGTKG